MNERKQILKIRNFAVSFNTSSGKLNAIRGVNFDLYQGETVAIVGESGSGKSVTVKAIMGIMSPNQVIDGGTIEFTYQDGKQGEKTVDILKLSQKQLRNEICGRRIAMVFQDPMTSLNPTLTIGRQLTEGMMYHFHTPKAEAYQRAEELLDLVGIHNAKDFLKSYPHQLSGGMRQRVVIAIALACNPDILICDEPTTALDVTIQAKILELIQDLQKKLNISVIYITHDLGVVAKVADYVNIMYAGKLVEKGTVNDIFYDPRHPYTWGLLSSMPDLDTSDTRLYTIPGTPPNLVNKVEGDAFAPRNPYALNIDLRMEPPFFKINGHHEVASWLAHPNAPKVEMPAALKARIEKMLREGENHG